MLSTPLPCCSASSFSLFFFFNDTATTEIYTLSLHDALPISRRSELCQAVHLAELRHGLLLVRAPARGARRPHADRRHRRGDRGRVVRQHDQAGHLGVRSRAGMTPTAFGVLLVVVSTVVE